MLHCFAFEKKERDPLDPVLSLLPARTFPGNI
jgi:hypothetical protein